MDESNNARPQEGLVDFLYRLWWIRLPFKVSRLSNTAAKSLMDGYYLKMYKPLMAFLPFLVFVLGFFWGWKDWGNIQVFSESKTLIMVIIAIGALSSNLGTMFLVGFILGDFVFDDHVIGNINDKSLMVRLILVNVPLIIKYSLLWMVLVLMPTLTKGFVLQLRLPPNIKPKVGIALNALLNVLITGAFIYYWAQIAAFIIRPLFTWQRASLHVAPFQHLQNETMSLVYVAMAVVALRMWLQYLTVFNEKIKLKVDEYEDDVWAEQDNWSDSIKINPWLVVSLYTAWTVLLVSGLYVTWKEAAILGLFVFLVYSVQRNLLPVPIDHWRRIVDKIPSFLRFIIIFILIYITGKPVVTEAMNANSFRPMIVLAGISIFIFFLFNPGQPKTESEKPKS